MEDADGGIHDGFEVEEQPRLDGAGEEGRQLRVDAVLQHPNLAVRGRQNQQRSTVGQQQIDLSEIVT